MITLKALHSEAQGSPAVAGEPWVEDPQPGEPCKGSTAAGSIEGAASATPSGLMSGPPRNPGLPGVAGQPWAMAVKPPPGTGSRKPPNRKATDSLSEQHRGFGTHLRCL